MTAPLSDVRVVAVEQYGAGPWATMQLADLGADVVKVEDPRVGGDVGRYVPPFADGESSLFFESFNRGKRSVALDLRDGADRNAFHALVATADAVLSNLRGDVPARLGLTYEQLAPHNPKLVCCSLSAFGMTGPRKRHGGYDFTVQGLAGWQSITGAPDAPPMRSGLSLVDFSGGYIAAIGLLAGIHAARRDGSGCDLDLSLFDGALSQLNYIATWSATHGLEPVRRRRSAHQSIVPFQNFPAADGWMVIACPKPGLWLALCRALERDDLADDPRFADFASRDRHRKALEGILDEVFATRTVAEWEALLAAAGVPCARINTVAQALADPQVAARDLIQEVDHPVLGPIRQVRSPLRFSNYIPALRRGPFLGEHSADLLNDLDNADDPLATMTADAIARAPTAEWRGRFFEDFEPGQVFRSRLGRTITETDNTWFTLLTVNTNQTHFNAEFAATEFVVSTLTLAVVVGLSVGDTSENAVANLGWGDIRLPKPVHTGDTLWAESEVTAVRPCGSRPECGIVSIRTRGVNQHAEVVIEFTRSFMVFRREAAAVRGAFPVTDTAWTV